MRALALHGFLGRGADWDAFAAAVDLPGLELDRPDLPGHGPHPRPVPPHFAAWVQWLEERLHMATAPVHLLGYSLGGRLALALALAEACTGKVASLTVLGASCGLASHDERRARAAADGELAAALERDGLAPFLDRWYRQPLFAPACRTYGHAALVASRGQGQAGPLAAALRASGTGAMPNLRPGLGCLRIPVLALAGTLDPKFCALGQEIAAGAPRGQLRTVDGAGHALLLEAPGTCARLWTEFINRHANPARTCHE
ncbi:MAG: alpha/beta fold hydrolase [Candidatus Krumholzibacteriia bacterium]